jgi:hypothetical protein
MTFCRESLRPWSCSAGKYNNSSCGRTGGGKLGSGEGAEEEPEGERGQLREGERGVSWYA